MVKMDEKLFEDEVFIGKLIKTGLTEFYEGLKDSLSTEEIQIVKKNLEKYINLSNEELGRLFKETFKKHISIRKFLSEIDIYLAVIKIASSLLELPEDLVKKIKDCLFGQLKVPLA